MSELKSVTWADLNAVERQICLARPSLEADPDRRRIVAEILNRVRIEGDAAVREFTRRLDGAVLDDSRVSAREIAEAQSQAPAPVMQAVHDAVTRIRAFHQAQVKADLRVETGPGTLCERRALAIERVGLYIPGGTAPLPSTLMMLAIPAQIAGCSEIALVTPPRKDGSLHPAILATAALLGIDEIYKCGGAQAVAALAFGTSTIAKVDKIFGPGNAWVTEAKLQVAADPNGAAIDMPAGPSEVLVIADRFARADFVAADLLSQAEHDRSSQVILVSTSAELIAAVNDEIRRQIADLPRREIAAQALASSRAVLVRDLGEAIEISNLYAPEHLILQVREARALSARVRHAGSVFIGPWSPESVGDYASGTNHVLPTYGYARAFSGVSVESFCKSITFQELTPSGLKHIARTVELLAEAEGLEAHRRAVHLRVNALEGEIV